MIFNLHMWRHAVAKALRSVIRPLRAPAHDPRTQPPAAHDADDLVPICSIGPEHQQDMLDHLLALDRPDRYLRYGYHATDDQIRHYVAHIHFERDEIFGIFNRQLALIAMAHLALDGTPQTQLCAEFGVSVARHARGRGYGGQLFERAVMHARNAGVRLLFIHALSDNRAMLAIARKAGAQVQRDGAQSEAYLRVPQASMDTRVVELVEEQIGATDYLLKAQAKQFWDFLADVQEVRQGVREGRHRAGN